MRTVGIWASGLLASAIPFIFVGAGIVFSACVFDAQGEHAPPASSRASFQEEAAPPEQALAVATANAPDDVPRQPVSTLAATPTHVAITTRRRASPVSTPA
jgi:hypothetical protein